MCDHTCSAFSHQRRQTSRKEKTKCFIVASDIISKKLIGQMRKQFLQRSWLALSVWTNHIWQMEVNTNILSPTKKLIGFYWSNQLYMALSGWTNHIWQMAVNTDFLFQNRTADITTTPSAIRESWRGIPISFPSSFFFQIPLCSSEIPFPFLIFNSQWPNPSPSVAWTPFTQCKTCLQGLPISLQQYLFNRNSKISS